MREGAAQALRRFAFRNGAGSMDLCSQCYRLTAEKNRTGPRPYFPHWRLRKLTAEQVRIIRSTPTRAELARRFGVSTKIIDDAARGRTYREVVP
jgi:hypothetical protein